MSFSRRECIWIYFQTFGGVHDFPSNHIGASQLHASGDAMRERHHDVHMKQQTCVPESNLRTFKATLSSALLAQESLLTTATYQYGL